MKQEPTITVGIVDGQTELTGRLTELSAASDPDCFPAGFREGGHGHDRAPRRIRSRDDPGSVDQTRGADNSTFRLSNVTIGKRFHWERTEEQTFQGDLVLRLRENGTITASMKSLETYLESVVSSEMNGGAPAEFLKTMPSCPEAGSWLHSIEGKMRGTPPSAVERQRKEERSYAGMNARTTTFRRLRR